MTNPTLHDTWNSAETANSPADQFVLGPLSDLLPQYAAGLERLFEQTSNPHPFLHPDCLRACFRDESAVALLAAVVRDGELRCAGILDPWTLTAGQVPGTSWSWQLPGRRIFAKGLLSDGCEDSVARWLSEIRIQLRNHHWAGLLLEACAVDTPMWHGLNDTNHGLKLLADGQFQPRWRVTLPSSVDEYWSQQFKGKTRNTLRRKRKKLGNYRVDVIVDPDDISGFLSAASAVSEFTWQSRQLGLRVRNSDRERRLFRTLAQRGAFRGHLMSLDDRHVAFAINTGHNGCLHFEETGFLPELSHLSPGTVLISELIDDVIRCGEYHTIDFGLGHADYKQMFSNQQTESANVWLLRNSPVNALAAGLVSGQDALRTNIKRSLRHFGVLGRVRKLRRAR